MWLLTHWKLSRALREYRRDRDMRRILYGKWEEDPCLSVFFDDLVKKLYGEEQLKLQQKQAQFLALQNQINPHFLYNSLEAIRADALMADCGEIAETTEALATFYRYTISNVQQFVTFSDELDNVENYFTVQKCRFGDKLSLEVEMENEQLLEARMPKLILQPLVENAVIHGLEQKIGDGTVRIVVENSADTLFVRVRDDGIGMPQAETERLNRLFCALEDVKEAEQGKEGKEGRKKRGGIALTNVNRRIRLMFGDDFGLRIFSAEGIGSECCVTLPLMYQNND